MVDQEGQLLVGVLRLYLYTPRYQPHLADGRQSSFFVSNMTMKMKNMKMIDNFTA